MSQASMSEADHLVPFLEPAPQPQNNETDDQEQETQLDQTLVRLETLLSFFGFHQTSIINFTLSWLVFLSVGVSVPIVILELTKCEMCEKYQVNRFELDIVVSQACLAAASLLCVSHNLRKYGIRRFLFVDRYHGHIVRFRKEYVRKIEGFFRLLVLWILPCFILKIIREVLRVIYVEHRQRWQTYVIFFGLVVSWTYLTTISLTACALFNLVCNLQVIHFDDYGKLLETESDVLVFIDEHMRLKHHLSKISHRFRIYLVLEFLVVTASQFVTLFQTTGYPGIVTFINGGDFAVTSIVQVVGIVFCLHAAAKISHRAQGIASVASKWHALVTATSPDGSQQRVANSVGNIEAANIVGPLYRNFSESDVESLDSVAFSTNTRMASYMSSYSKRQAFVMYLQSNPGGVTVFGWTIDRGLINTIFFVELSLILFVLSKTIVFSTTN